MAPQSDGAWIKRFFLRRRRPEGSLSSKLLVLTLLFVMLSEVLIYVPSIANFYRDGIGERLEKAKIAAHTLVSSAVLPEPLQRALLEDLDAHALAVREKGVKRLLAMGPAPPMVNTSFALVDLGPYEAIAGAFRTLIAGEGETFRVSAPLDATSEIELVFPGRGLQTALFAYSRNILLLSLVISAFTAGLVYLALRRLFVMPMRHLSEAVRRWAEAPEDGERSIIPSGRQDEIGRAEEELAAMQRHVREVLTQKRRLAELGLAVSKINHDLRNLLASAQLFSDRLTMIPDPTVQRFAPQLIAALDRAISYAETVLAYGKAQESPPVRRLVRLQRLVDEVAEMAGLPLHPSIEWVSAVPADLEIDADAEHVFRVLLNLFRNAIQALEQDDTSSCVKRLAVSANRLGSVVRIIVRDTGPGLPEKARAHLFTPFQGSGGGQRGTGLGLAIAAELVRAHGGSISAMEDGPGAAFVIEIPDRPVRLADVREARVS